MTQPFEDFLVEMHNKATTKNEDEGDFLKRVRMRLLEHFQSNRGIAPAAERDRVRAAFISKGLTTSLSRRILDVIVHVFDPDGS